MPQISSSGRIVRENNTIIPSLRPLRLILVSATLCLLYITNPANDISKPCSSLLNFFDASKDTVRSWCNNSNNNESNNFLKKDERKSRRKYVGSLSFDLFGIEMDIFESFKRPSLAWNDGKSVTNFEFFALDDNFSNDGVFMSILNQRFPICRFYGPEAELCDWIADNLCHGMKTFDPKYRPFTAHRILSYMLLSSLILSKCSTIGNNFKPVASMHNLAYRPLSIPLSVFAAPDIVEDLIFLNLFVYPSLVVMDKLISTGANSKDDAPYQFFWSVSFLVLGLGGLFANLLSSHITQRGVYGMRGVVAAALGYHMTVSSKIMVKTMGMNLTASDALYSVVILATLDSYCSFFNGIFGLRAWDKCSILAWVLGGVGGSLFGNFQLERYQLWWHSW